MPPNPPYRKPYSTVHRLSSIVLFLLSAFLHISCVSPAPAAPTQTISAYATSSAQPWLSELFACANERAVAVNVNANAPDISLRVGEPENLSAYVYRVGEEEILVVAHRESAVQNLSLAEVRALFAGQGEPSVQVWVYPSALDIFEVFEQVVMQGRSAASFARVAVSVEAVSDAVGSESNAVGILPKHRLTENMREVYSLGTFPVLALTDSEPQGAVRDLLACLQDG